MTFAAVGSGFGTSGSSSLSLTTSTIGDFILAEVLNHNGTAAPTGLSSSNVTWSTLGTPYTATVASGVIQCFIGTVTAASTATLTVTLGAGTTGTLDWCGQEFSSTAGIPVLDVQGHVDTLSSNTNWASLTPAAAGELYWGYCQNAANAAAGSTSGYVYNANIDTADNGMAYNLSCGATATFPVWGDVTESLGMMVLVTAPAASAPAGVPAALPGKTWRRRFQHRQQPQSVPAAAATSAPAGLAQATGTALAAVVTVAPAAGLAQATATAISPAPTVAPAAGLAQATATALTPSVTASPAAGFATATATALGPVPDVIVTAGLAQATATALNATVTTSGTTNAPAGLATATATALAPSVTVAPAAGLVQAAATGLAPAATVSPAAGIVQATATGQAPVVTVAVSAGLASATATAQQPTVQTSSGVNANAGVAQATATARNPAAAVTVTAGLATATAAALPVLFGGQPLSAVLLGGTVTPAAWGGSVTTQAYAGSVTTVAYAATVTTLPYSGTITGGIVGVQSDLQAIVSNDEYFYLALTYNGAALNLTGYTLKAYLKATRFTPDSEAAVFTTGSGLTITNMTGGLVTWDIPHADLPNPTTQWYRVDVIDSSSEVFTALYGNLQVLPA